MNKRLSSDYLYNYKWDYNSVKATVQYGFRHNGWEEEIPLTNSLQINFIVCFCDIMWKDNKVHMSWYGKNIFVMKKEWAKKNGITPLTYIHKDTPFFNNDQWLARKWLNRIIRGQTSVQQQLINVPSLASPQDFVLALEYAEQEINNQKIDKQFIINHGKDVVWHQNFITNLVAYLKTNKNSGSLFPLLNILFEELERRDSFLRIYDGMFNHPVAKRNEYKILYEEREWRSMKLAQKLSDIQYYPDGRMYLGSNYNLSFNDDDVEYIVLEHHKDREDLINLIKTGNTLLTEKSLNKIKLLCKMKKILSRRMATGEVF